MPLPVSFFLWRTDDPDYCPPATKFLVVHPGYWCHSSLAFSCSVFLLSHVNGSSSFCPWVDDFLIFSVPDPHLTKSSDYPHRLSCCWSYHRLSLEFRLHHYCFSCCSSSMPGVPRMCYFPSPPGSITLEFRLSHDRFSCRSSSPQGVPRTCYFPSTPSPSCFLPALSHYGQ